MVGRFYLLFTAIILLSCNEEDKKILPVNTSVNQEAEFIKSIEAYPDSFLLQENLANFYQENGDYEKAIVIMKKRLSEDSLNDKLHEALGYLYFENDDTAQSINYYKNAYKLVPDKDYLIALATLEAGKQNPIALQLADEILRIDKINSADKAFYVKGIYYSRVGQKELAIEHLDNAIKSGYTFTPPYLEKAGILMGQKKYQEAVNTLDKGIAAQNNFPEAYYYKAMSLYALGNKAESLKAFDMALLYDPNYEDAINDKQKYFGNK